MKKKLAYITIVALFLASGVVAFEGENIKLTNENLIGLVFSSMDDGEYTDESYRKTIIGLAFCKEEDVETVGECVSSDSWGEESSVSLAEILSKARSQNRDLEKIDTPDEGSSTDQNDETSDTTLDYDQNLEQRLNDGEPTVTSDEGHDHTFGDLYFYETNENEELVTSDAENDYQNQKVQYDMEGGEIEGRFTWNNLDEIEHTLWVRNEDSEDEPVITTSSSPEITVPYGDRVFGAFEDDIYQISDTCSTFTVAVLPPDWDGQESDVTYDAIQLQQFEFCPFNNEQKYAESENYWFEITPQADEITSETDVTLRATGTDFEDKRLKLEVNDVRGVNNDPYSIEECSGTSCSVTVEADRIENQPGEILAKVQEYDSKLIGSDWTNYEMASWNIEK